MIDQSVKNFLSDENITNELKKHNKNVPIILFSSLTTTPEKLLYNIKISDGKGSIIFVGEEGKIGHWVCIKLYGRKRINYFDSYGYTPISARKNFIAGSQQYKILTYINTVLAYLFYKGYDIHYNNVPFQTIGDGSTDCGEWCIKYILYPFNLSLESFLHSVSE